MRHTCMHHPDHDTAACYLTEACEALEAAISGALPPPAWMTWDEHIVAHHLLTSRALRDVLACPACREIVGD